MTKKQLSWRIIELKGETDAIIGSIFYAKHLEDHYTKNQLISIINQIESGAEFFGNFGYDCCMRMVIDNHYYYYPINKDGTIGEWRELK